MPEEQEPSIEEILASIRQIISDDDDEEPTAQADEPEAAPVIEADDDILELTEKVDEEGAPAADADIDFDSVLESVSEPEEVSPDDIDFDSEPEFEPEPEPEPEKVEVELHEMEDADDDMNEARDVAEENEEDGDSIFTDSAENAALQGFMKLASKVPLDRRGTGGTTIEDIIREMMKPMLREWLDIHLPPLIEKVVQKELRNIARRATEDD